MRQEQLRDLEKVLKRDAVRQAMGDVFGWTYEYFLLKDSKSNPSLLSAS